MTHQEKARIYSKLYINHRNLGNYLLSAKELGLKQDEAEVVWESIDHYEDMRPEAV